MELTKTSGLVFFTDITGFSRLVKDHTLEESAGVVHQFAELTAFQVAKAGGTVVKYIGDAALGYFPADRVDDGIKALKTLQQEVETGLSMQDKRVGLRVGAHFGEFGIYRLPPLNHIDDLIGHTVNIAATVGSGGQSKHRGKMIITPEAFRKLAPETRKMFHKFTEPVVYLG